MSAKELRTMALPGGALAKACNYTLTLWDKLTRFLEYPELELSKAMVSYCTSSWGLSWAGVSSVC
jgi:hypothetical protein